MTTGKTRSLGLDVGERRIGVAISDPLGMTAAGLETITRQNMAADVEAIVELAKRHHVVEIVLGLPQNTDGSETDHARQVVSFGKKLAQASGLPVIYEEGGLSSVSAIRTFTVQNAGKAGHSNDLVDRQAAAIILQKYLDGQEPPPTA